MIEKISIVRDGRSDRDLSESQSESISKWHHMQGLRLWLALINIIK